MKRGWIYILECSDGTYYTGCTSDLDRRLWEHETGFFHGYTSSRRPVKFLWAEEFDDIRDAIAFERQVKGWSRKKKEALMKGEYELLPELSKSKSRKRTSQSGLSADQSSTLHRAQRSD